MFVVLWEDRHADPDVYLFTEQEQAVRFARTSAKEASVEGNRDGSFYKETEHDSHGWSMTFEYSPENDRISVYEEEVDEKASPVPLSEMFQKFAAEAREQIKNQPKPPAHGQPMETISVATEEDEHFDAPGYGVGWQ